MSEETYEGPTEAPGDNSEKIDFEKYDEIPVEVSGRDAPAAIQTWTDLDLGEGIQRNIQAAKYTKPTPIQRHALPIGMAGRDLMGCAQTGSGKTAAFLLPIIAQLVKSRYSGSGGRQIAISALILSPTRELAQQTHAEAIKFAAGTRLKAGIVYGGASFGEQARRIQAGCDLLVATPGRLIDFVKRGQISLQMVKYLILDEADRMLDMGFEPDIRKIVETFDMPGTGRRQTMMFSATFPKEIQVLASEFLFDYVFLTVGRVGAAAELVKQNFMRCLSEDPAAKDIMLIDLLRTIKGLTLVFCETKRDTARVASLLTRSSFPAVAIHGDLEQRQREYALSEFSTGRKPIMVATNVAARGLDIRGVAQVVNYDMARTIDEYVHRIGRTGRAGASGSAYTFITGQNSGLVRELQEILTEANQEIPAWFTEITQYDYKRKGGKKFGGRDYRNGNYAHRGRGGYHNNYSNYTNHASAPYQQQQTPYSTAPLYLPPPPPSYSSAPSYVKRDAYPPPPPSHAPRDSYSTPSYPPPRDSYAPSYAPRDSYAPSYAPRDSYSASSFRRDAYPSPYSTIPSQGYGFKPSAPAWKDSSSSSSSSSTSDSQYGSDPRKRKSEYDSNDHYKQRRTDSYTKAPDR